MQVGDASTVFWASKSTPGAVELERDFKSLDEGSAVRSLFKSVESGAYRDETDSENADPARFYVLGLAPNAARIAIRFFVVATVEEMAERICQHFEDTQIQKQFPNEPDYLPFFRLLVSTAVKGESKKILPNLAGDMMRAILYGSPYPRTLLMAAVQRTRAEQEVNYPRASLIKACLNRDLRIRKKRGDKIGEKEGKELTVALDTGNESSGYLLGRLFATLEKIQGEAIKGVKATIRDRFYGAASGTPSVVFPNLMRLTGHHLSKLENEGLRVNRERLLGEIIAGLTDFPSHLPLEEQGRFAIGYYHQMRYFYTKKENGDESRPEPEE